MTETTTQQAIAAELAADEPQQIDLFAEPETEGGQRRASSGRGRPAGARNKRTLLGERRLEWLQAHYQDPVEGMLAIAQANPADLAALWSCALLEAVQIQVTCRRDAAPYLRSKRPIAVSVEGKTAVYLTIVDGTIVDGELQPGDGASDVTPLVITNEQFQRLSENVAAPSRAENVQPDSEEAKNG